MFLFPVTGKECYNIMMKLKNSKTSTDQISMKVMKQFAHNLSIPISKLINTSFKKGVFPDVLKIACITPLPKIITPVYLSHFRPISVLPALYSKIFERYFLNRLVSYFDKNSILCNSQYGFRKNRKPFYLSTEYIY